MCPASLGLGVAESGGHGTVAAQPRRARLLLTVSLVTQVSSAGGLSPSPDVGSVAAKVVQQLPGSNEARALVIALLCSQVPS